MKKPKYECVEGRDYYMCDSIPNDEITISRTNSKKISLRSNSKTDFNLELQKLINVNETKEEKDNKFHNELKNLIDFYKNSRKYRDVNGNIIRKTKEENSLTPYQKMRKINEEIKTFYDEKISRNKINFPFIVKNTKSIDFNYINNINKNNNSIKNNNDLNNLYKIQPLKNLTHYNNFSIKNKTIDQSKEISKENSKKENIKKSLSSRNNAKLNKVYCYSHKLLNPSRLKIQKDDLNSNKTMNKFHFKNAFNDIYNWEIKLIKPNNTVKQSLKRQKATNNILQDLEDYNLIQFNMKQLLKRDAKHKDKFILNTRRNSVAKRKSINDEVTNNNISYKDKNKLTSSRKGSTMNNFKTIKLNEYYNLTYS